MDKWEILKKYFGYDSFREGQEKLIDAILSGQDVLGIMPTGAGKSLCYQVPALLLPGITLVISPLISLMKDQVQSLNQAGIHAAYINSSLSEGQIVKALQYASAGQYKIIYVAPERLETDSFQAFADRADISMVTVDEAHCISQWGQDFRPSYLQIVHFVLTRRVRPVVSAFTATATETVKQDIVNVLQLQTPEVLVTGFDRKNLYFGVETPRKRTEFVLRYVREHSADSIIIYCLTRKNVDALYEELLEAGTPVTKYHAGLSADVRRENQDDFIYDKKPVMVATNAFGMGIDKSNVRSVIHYNMPQSLENYYQEAGRAGRDGETAECILLYSPQDIMVNRFLLESKEQDVNGASDWEEIRRRDESRLQLMVHYCTTKNCLREYILHYFGEQMEDTCGNCSNCVKEYEQYNCTQEAIQILTCIQELRQRYGINVIAGTLNGSSQARLRQYGVSEYASFGSMKDHTEAGIKELINDLIAEGILFTTPDKYSLLHMGKSAEAILAGKQEVFVKRFLKTENIETESESRSKGIKKKKSRKTDALDSQGMELFEKLRELRTQLAREENVPPYIVFSDKTLVDMCVRRPHNREEMLQVNGVGENKYERYGERFLEKLEENGSL